MEKLLMIGQNTSDGEISAWGYDGTEPGMLFEKRFCEMLARDTNNTVFVIRGEIVRRYRCIDEPQVECVDGNPLPPGRADIERKLNAKTSTV